MSESKVAYRYKPAADGDHIVGVESRDYTQDEWDALEPRLQRDAVASGVFVAVQHHTDDKPKDKDDKK